MYNNEEVSEFHKQNISWGTYNLQNDTITAFLIETLFGCDGYRKNIVTAKFSISDNKQLK